jgi:cytochrome c
MNKFLRAALFAFALLTPAASIFAADQAESDAVNLVAKAAKFYKANGQEKAFAAFNDKNGEFQKGGLYLFVVGLDGVTAFNAVNPKLVGKSQMEIEDVNGKKFLQEMVELAKTKGSGWVEYMYKNPASGQIQPKKSYVQRIPGTELFAACGIYKSK